MNDMTQLLYSMEQSMKLQNRARAARRAAKAEQEKREFQEKLLQAEASKIELDCLSARKMTEDLIRLQKSAGGF